MIKFKLFIISDSDINISCQPTMTEPTKLKEEDDVIDIEQSDGMDEAEQQLFLNVRRSKSDDSFLGKLLLNKSEMQKRPLILDVNQNNNNGTGFRVFKKIKKQRKKNLSDYRKNICGYITKKIIREFVSPNYFHFVKQLCQKHSCDYATMKSYYLSKIQRVTGPSHIPGLLIPENPSEITLKKVFRDFFQWFLKERYLRYLLLEGKMSDKKAYIDYKNNIMMGMLKQTDSGNFDFSHMKEQEDDESSQSQLCQKDQNSQLQNGEKYHKEGQKEIKLLQNNAKNPVKIQKKQQKLVPMIPIAKKDFSRVPTI